MAVASIPRLKPSTNIEMMNAIRDAASPAYQNFIPEVDQANIKQSIQQLMTHRATRNEFMDILVNRIGLVTVTGQSWENPLGIFKKGFLAEGDTVEELAVDIIKPLIYEDDREAMERMLFGTHRVGAQASFHKVNRQDIFAVTTNEMQLSRAFLDSQGGLMAFQAQILAAPQKSDNYAEYLLMANLIHLYNEEGGFFNINTPNLQTLESSETDAKKALKLMRTYARKLQFMSRLYNAAGLMAHAPVDRMVVLTTPEFRAAVDVDAMMGAFNKGDGEIWGRIVEVQQEDVNIPGFQAIITTEDFFQVYDKLITTSQQWNAVTLSNNHFLHHHQVMSVSRFVPALLLSTNPTTPTTPIVYTSASVGAIVATDKDDDTVTADLVRGEVYNLTAKVVTTPLGGKIGHMWGITGNTDPQTFIREEGVLHVGPNEEGPLKIVAISVENTAIVSAELSLTVDATTGVAFWPRDRNADGEPDEVGDATPET